jgi:hypothetical protein
MVTVKSYRLILIEVVEMNYNERLQKLVNKYIESGGDWPTSSHELAAWALKNNLWAPKKGEIINIFAEQLSRAMREEYIVDPQGRKVRAKHAARVNQGVLWDDIRTAGREHMLVSFQQRRQGIVGDCHQLKLEVDSYNDNKNNGMPIQMVFDFTVDLIEMDINEKEDKTELVRS